MCLFRKNAICNRFATIYAMLLSAEFSECFVIWLVKDKTFPFKIGQDWILTEKYFTFIYENLFLKIIRTYVTFILIWCTNPYNTRLYWVLYPPLPRNPKNTLYEQTANIKLPENPTLTPCSPTHSPNISPLYTPQLHQSVQQRKVPSIHKSWGVLM